VVAPHWPFSSAPPPPTQKPILRTSRRIQPRQPSNIHLLTSRLILRKLQNTPLPLLFIHVLRVVIPLNTYLQRLLIWEDGNPIACRQKSDVDSYSAGHPSLPFRHHHRPFRRPNPWILLQPAGLCDILRMFPCSESD
jgi:hypothetical protein